MRSLALSLSLLSERRSRSRRGRLHCGKCEKCIHDATQTASVAVGDLLLIKGTRFPGVADNGLAGVANALVHKSPEKRFDAAGEIINRLVLKVDVDELWSESAGPGNKAPDAVARAVAARK